MWCTTCVCCSWFICLRPGETVRWRPWIQTSLIVTASQPVALTAKRATWWTTATAAWCTCPVGDGAYCVLYRSYINDAAVRNDCRHFKDWCEYVFLMLKAMHPTAPPSCTKNVLTQLLVRKRLWTHQVWIIKELIHAHSNIITWRIEVKVTGMCSKGQDELSFVPPQISWWSETTTSACVRRHVTWPDTAKSCPSSRSPARLLLNILQRNTTNLSSISSKASF